LRKQVYSPSASFASVIGGNLDMYVSIGSTKAAVLPDPAQNKTNLRLQDPLHHTNNIDY
jgi:hypothetical protein